MTRFEGERAIYMGTVLPLFLSVNARYGSDPSYISHLCTTRMVDTR